MVKNKPIETVLGSTTAYVQYIEEWGLFCGVFIYDSYSFFFILHFNEQKLRRTAEK